MSARTPAEAAADGVLYNCQICERMGTRDDGIRCVTCQAFFHAICLSPFGRTQNYDTVYNSSKAIVYVCDDCADQLECINSS